MSSTLDIKLQGREYRVACAPEEFDTLSAAAALLDARMGEAARTTRSTGERLAVMAALNLAYELNAMRKSGVTPVVHDSAPVEKAVDADDLQRRIKIVEARLDEALARQDELF
ncbi:MAG: cell division protein ZapA [Rhodocyclaceae bacterium]|nr:cell division protein ZapA [Rhodocyclaceae bacterium]MDP3032721.1 cell division protein ZapA [Rhodocyclaceae bacterium]